LCVVYITLSLLFFFVWPLNCLFFLDLRHSTTHGSWITTCAINSYRRLSLRTRNYHDWILCHVQSSCKIIVYFTFEGNG
jgi:hypothetical protein